MKHTLAAAACSAAVVVGLTACSGGDDKAALPGNTTTPSPSTTAASQPTTTPPTVCVDQSKLVQVRKDGSHFLDTDTNGKRNPTLKMTATINRGMTGPELTRLSSAAGTC